MMRRNGEGRGEKEKTGGDGSRSYSKKEITRGTQARSYQGWGDSWIVAAKVKTKEGGLFVERVKKKEAPMNL